MTNPRLTTPRQIIKYTALDTLEGGTARHKSQSARPDGKQEQDSSIITVESIPKCQIEKYANESPEKYNDSGGRMKRESR